MSINVIDIATAPPEVAALVKQHDTNYPALHTNLLVGQCACTTALATAEVVEQAKVTAKGQRDGGVCWNCGGMTVQTGSCTECVECFVSSGGCG